METPPKPLREKDTLSDNSDHNDDQEYMLESDLSDSEEEQAYLGALSMVAEGRHNNRAGSAP